MAETDCSKIITVYVPTQTLQTTSEKTYCRHQGAGWDSCYSQLRINTREIGGVAARSRLGNSIFLKCGYLGVTQHFCSSPWARGKPLATDMATLSWELFFSLWTAPTRIKLCPKSHGLPHNIFSFHAIIFNVKLKTKKKQHKEAKKRGTFSRVEALYRYTVVLSTVSKDLLLFWQCRFKDRPFQIEREDRLLYQVLVHDAVKHRQSVAHC